MKTLIISFSKLLTTLVLALFAISGSLIAQQPNITLSQPNLQAGRTEEQTQPKPLGVSAAEPQFKFWLAFEVYIGQTDTLWVVIDSTAKSNQTLPYDSILGELPLLEQGSGKFLVYYKIHDYDSFKVVANTPSFKEVSINILAQNYHLPITVRWDTSLLTNNNLPWDIGTATLEHSYMWPCCHNLLLSDSLLLES